SNSSALPNAPFLTRGKIHLQYYTLWCNVFGVRGFSFQSSGKDRRDDDTSEWDDRILGHFGCRFCLHGAPASAGIFTVSHKHGRKEDRIRSGEWAHDVLRDPWRRKAGGLHSSHRESLRLSVGTDEKPAVDFFRSSGPWTDR